ncbi:hypothetical protein Tco_0099652 [Tanacetum coccineum]
MAKQVELNKKKGKGTGQGENRPVWNNVQRLNHQNKFVPKAVLTKTGIFPVNTARQNLSSQAATTSTARKVNTARPIDNPQRALKEQRFIMKIEAMVEERRIFKCWFYNHTTNGHQFTMSNRHQELVSPEQTASGKDFSNPLMADSLPKTVW